MNSKQIHIMKLRFALFLSLLTFQVSAQTYDVVILNGRIIDGSGNPWFLADLGIKNGKILTIGKLKAADATKVIDAKGLVVAPGFIDVHTHIEGGIENIPTADNFIYDGVTTLITGNCGGSEENLSTFFETLRKSGISANVGSFIGHNTVRRKVMKNVFRDPTANEQILMENLVEKSMQDGAFGLSTGLIYIPGTYSKTAEVVGLARAAAKHGGIYTSHIRDEEATVKDAIEEAINIGREAQIPVEISHFKILGKPLWGQSDQTLRLVQQARIAGIDVNIDQYPYTASSTNLGTRLPSWALADGDSVIHFRLNDPETRLKIRNEMVEMVRVDARKNYDYAVVARYKADSTFNGKSITEINKILGRKSKLAVECELIMDMLDKGGAQMIYHRMNEADVENILRYPNTMIASDAGVIKFGKDVPHPRGYGTNSRILGRYVREKNIITLEDAIRRMTSLPAQRFRIENRGLIRQDFAADIVVFDPNTVTDNATYELPHAYSTGFEWVLVNGVPVIENTKHIGSRPGQIVFGKGKL